jgi:hypothetical protein
MVYTGGLHDVVSAWAMQLMTDPDYLLATLPFLLLLAPLLMKGA